MFNMQNMFDEPREFTETENPPTFVNYERRNPPDHEPAEVTLRLVGKSPLWGHLLWNAGKVSAEYVDTHRDELKDKTVIELGAAAALPALLASLVARNVVATDYPDPDLIENINHNIQLLSKQSRRTLPISAQGYIWGHDVTTLLNAPRQNGEKFDVIILSDLLFNHSEHQKLIDSCRALLKEDGQVLIVFTPHRPKLFQQDLAFFTLAEHNGFRTEKIIERQMTPMFEEEEETRQLRSMVFGYLMHWAERNNH